MAWGLIEQRLYHDIIRLQQAKNKNLYPHEAELAATFDDRVKQWRRLCASITSKLTDVDRVITKLKNLALVRHHLAHGYPIYFPGFSNIERLPTEPYLEIIEHRETKRRLLRHIKLAKENKLGRVWATDLYARYTLTDLESCQSALDRDPRSASKRDPLVLRFERLAFAPSELVGVAETGRARVVG